MLPRLYSTDFRRRFLHWAILAAGLTKLILRFDPQLKHSEL